MVKKKPKPTSTTKPTPGATAYSGGRNTANAQADSPILGQKAVYIGVEAGSDLEQYGYQSNPNYRANPAFNKMNPFRGMLPRKPLYKVGYLNSKDFARELGNMNPNAIYQYQQYMNQAGILDKFTPGQLDAATRRAFKELITQANQSAGTWQDQLGNALQAGGQVGGAGKQAPDAFVAQLDDPATLREAFQSTAQSLYGGNLPDSEVNAMVDAYRSIQQQKQQTSYNAALAANAGGVSGTVENEASPSDFAAQEIRAKHPDQVAKVEFSGTLSKALQALGTTGGGLM